MSITDYNKLDQLGGDAGIAASPDQALLERVESPTAEPYLIRLSCPEFTSICPVTGQPDFAHLVIDYCPDKWIVESKSFKLYLGSSGIRSLTYHHTPYGGIITVGYGWVLKLSHPGAKMEHPVGATGCDSGCENGAPTQVGATWVRHGCDVFAPT